LIGLLPASAGAGLSLLSKVGRHVKRFLGIAFQKDQEGHVHVHDHQVTDSSLDSNQGIAVLLVQWDPSQGDVTDGLTDRRDHLRDLWPEVLGLSALRFEELLLLHAVEEFRLLQATSRLSDKFDALFGFLAFDDNEWILALVEASLRAGQFDCSAPIRTLFPSARVCNEGPVLDCVRPQLSAKQI
jgi:hypothetical protein